MKMRKLIVKMAKHNIGSLCLFLKGAKNKAYLELINNTIPKGTESLKLPEKIWYFVNQVNELQVCSCGKSVKFIGFKMGYRKSCENKECRNNHRKETCLKLYGTEYPMKSDKVKEKQTKTINKRYGKHFMLTEEGRNKFTTTMIEKYGVAWAQQNKELKERSIKTFNENPDKDKIIEKRSATLRNKSEEEKEEIQYRKLETILKKYKSLEEFNKIVKDKTKISSQEKYGKDHYMESEELIQKRIKTYKQTILNRLIERLPKHITYISDETEQVKIKCSNCNTETNINKQYLYFNCLNNQDPCSVCSPTLFGKANMESQILEFIKSNYNGEIIANTKSVLTGLELDIYLPEINLAFEFNGLYWNSDFSKDRLYHRDKSDICMSLGIKLIYIWEDDFLLKSNIIKSMILDLLNKSFNINSDNCIVNEVPNSEYKNFLDENHIDGFTGANVKLGLYFNNELVSLMSFGDLGEDWELSRFCNKLNTNNINAESKLLNYFIDTYVPQSIIVYSDKCWPSKILNGFNFIGTSEPNYYYVVDGVRKHRFDFRKDKLVKMGYDENLSEFQIMTELGYNRIWDCGTDKWKWVNNI